MVGHRRGAVNFILPVSATVLIPERNLVRGEDRCRCDYNSTRLVLTCTEIVDRMNKFSAVHQIEFLAQLLVTLIEAVIHNRFSFLALFGGDENHTVCSL